MRPASIDQARIDAQVDALLDQLDEALLAGRADAVQAITAKLWPRRRDVPGVLVLRLIEGRARVAVFAFDLLRGFAGSRLPVHLRRIYEDARAADLTRWAARRRAGWPERGQAAARQAFLARLRDPRTTLQQALSVANASTPPDAEVLQELLAYLLVIAPEERHHFLELAIAEADPQLDWLLRGMVHVPDPPLQRAVIVEIVRRRDPGATGALTRLAATAGDATIRDQASAAARRLQIAEVRPGSPAQVPSLPAWPPLESVLATNIDGDGGQALALIRVWAPHQTRLVVHFFHKDGWGLKDVFGFSRETDDVEESVVGGFFKAGLPMLEIGLPLARGIIDHATSRNTATGYPIPPAFEVWAPYFHDQFPPAPNETTLFAELDDRPFAQRADLVGRARLLQLLRHPYFAYWTFDMDRLEPLLGLMPTWRTRRPTAGQIAQVISGLVDTSSLEVLRSRLRRQARLLDVLGDESLRDVALATSASLARRDMTLGRHPFLNLLLEHTLAGILVGEIRQRLPDF